MKDFVDELIDLIFDNNNIGRKGEKLTEFELKIVRLFGRRGLILKNVYIPKDNGETSEIDLVYITQKGIFVIESKNYSGWIFGSESDYYWTQSLPNGKKNRFYNPILQNRTHIKWLLQYLGEEVPFFSLIVFSERCKLKKITFEEKTVGVLKRDELYGTIRYLWKKLDDVWSDEKINRIYNALLPLTNADDALKQQHIDQITRKNKKEEHPQNQPKKASAELPYEVESTEICPRCGAALILRTAKKGANAGKQFYGCSAFPKCRYIKNIE